MKTLISLKSLFKKLLVGDEASSKRFITIVMALTIILIAFLNMIFKFVITEFIFSGIETIVLVGLGAILGEHISDTIRSFKDKI